MRKESNLTVFIVVCCYCMQLLLLKVAIGMDSCDVNKIIFYKELKNFMDI